jgi:hypothetical protein
LGKIEISASDIVGAIEGSLLLNLPRLYGHGGDTETEVFSYLHRVEFGGIEPRRNSIECVDQSAVDGNLTAHPKTSACAGILYPHKAPSGLANHGIEDRCVKVFNPHPVVANLLQRRVQPVWKDTALAQKNRVQSHSCALGETVETGIGIELASLFGAEAFSSLTFD